MESLWWWCVQISSVYFGTSLLPSKRQINWYAAKNTALKYAAIQYRKETPIPVHRNQLCLRWSATHLPPTPPRHVVAAAGFSILRCCLEAGLRPPTGGQILLLLIAAHWRCCHDRNGGVLLLIRCYRELFTWSVLSKNHVTEITQVRRSHVKKSHKLAKNVEVHATETQ